MNTGSLIGQGFDDGQASFALRFRGIETPYSVFFATALPGDTITIEVIEPEFAKKFVAHATGGEIRDLKHGHWLYTAPRVTGLYPLTVKAAAPEDSIVLNIFVMFPYDQLKGESLNGYRMGKYPAIPLKNLAIYKPPAGFIEVTRENVDVQISPHFKLRQFLCKQDGGYPKYVVLREKLLLKLELILEHLNEAGYACPTLTVMSGYRTPYYNKTIGNVKYSRHVWGGAADIYIDTNGDEMMDDLNRDGKADYKDAMIVYELVDGMYGKPWYEKITGGLGLYHRNAKHGPFVHVDVRGRRARWGD